MKNVEALREIVKFKRLGTASFDKEQGIQAVSSAIKLYEELEKVEGVLPEEKTCCPEDRWEKGHNALLHQLKLNLSKAGLCRKPTEGEIEDCIDDKRFNGDFPIGLNFDAIQYIAHAIVDMLSKEER